MIYLVIQQGIYRHDIRGVYTSAALAESAAKRAAAEDSDSYHDYEVHYTTLDEYVEDVSPEPGVPHFSKDHLGGKCHICGDSTAPRACTGRYCGRGNVCNAINQGTD